MKHLKTERYEVALNNRDWNQLLKRFDARRAKRDRAMVEIPIQCICNHYGNYCEGCPFKVAECPFTIGCTVLAHELLGDEIVIRFGRWCIYWYSSEDTQAREEIQKVREWLLSAEDVK